MAYGVLQIEAGFDLADIAGGLVLSVVETGGSSWTTTLSTGTYFLRTDASASTGDFASLVTSYTDLLTAIEDDFNANGSGTWSITFDVTSKLVQFDVTGGGVTAASITPTSGGGLVGLDSAASGSTALEGDRTPDYYIDSDIGYWAEWDEREVEPDAMVDVVAHDGTPHGIAPEGVETHLDLVVPMEPRAKVYTRFAASSDPWAWQALFRHVRNVEPLAIYDGEETHFVRLRKEGAAFRPRKVSQDYVGHYDVPLLTRLLARA